MKHLFLITISFILFNFQSYAQHEADFWYFGNHAGLDFSSGKPEPRTNGQLKNYEGCATISDSTGNLLFYTNGMTVWNKEHQVMENGDGLMGDSSSTQSAIVVPQPGNDSLFYLFTADVLRKEGIDNYQHKGFNYSIININNNEGLGNVTQKNILLMDSVTEKISSVQHSNGNDIWVITHDWGNNKFYSWLINEFGINANPIINSVGTPHLATDSLFLSSIGHLKSAANGKKLVVAILKLSLYEVFNFNNETGEISNPLTLNFTTPSYSCEFSPDASKLYMSNFRKIIQADMNAGTNTDIINSVTEIAELEHSVGALQLANNGKLYVTNNNSQYLSVINYPDSLPATCGFEQDAIYLEGRKARLGLPNFIQSYFKNPNFKVENTCLYDETQFIINGITEIDSVIWNFDDVSSGSLNISKELSPIHIFSEVGIYKVNLTVWHNNITYYYSENIKIVPLPELNLGNDTIFCVANNHTIDAYTPHLSYLWNDLSTDSILQVNSSGKYWTEIENTYTRCKNSDTINIIFSEIPEINIGNDTSFCENTTYIIDAYNEGYSYTWQDNSTEASFIADTAGVYNVIVANENDCENSDTISLSIKKLPRFYFPKDSIICENSSFYLSPNINADFEFLWQDQSTNNSFLVSNEGFYKLIVTNICGTWSDSLNITTKYCGEIYIPNIFTPTKDGINELFKIKGIDEDAWGLTIYSRWGNIVYNSSNYKNDWDGNNLSPAVYYYVLSNIRLNEQYKGTVRIIRSK